VSDVAAFVAARALAQGERDGRWIGDRRDRRARMT
jgi:hypothetical protein